ncbi:hypothetical protein AB0M46_30545 [Dactylosporangium sp. NPDC051485]|uniref:hypothetical protein n=1 Tax=Dactylosporangium sp. NPDC051485 TaxID=3154846 RepID=UPI003442DD9C
MTDFDPAAPFEELRELRQAVGRRDWPAVAARFAALTDPNDHEYAAGIVAGVAGSEDFLAACAEREPGTLARTLYAGRLISAGWEVRSSARAKNVSREQFATFHDHLRRAERILVGVTAEEPANATAWTSRIRVNRGLQLGQNEARRRYDRLSRHVPHVYAAQAGIVQQFCPKWSGSFEKARAFGLECLRAAPDGSLAPLALLEVYVEICFEEGNGKVWKLPETRAEVYEAADRSVRHPAFRADGYRALTAHNLFALVFWVMGDRAAARPHFEFVGEHGGGDLWNYFSPTDGRSLYLSARKAVVKS